MRKYYRNVFLAWLALASIVFTVLLYSVTTSKLFAAQYHSTLLIQRNPGVMEMTFVHRFVYQRYDEQKVFFNIETDSNEVKYKPGQTVLIQKTYFEYWMIAYSAFIVLSPLVLVILALLAMAYLNK